MSRKAERVLTLLEALQDRPAATGPELAARLGVDVRTLRRDVEALRGLGIPVEGQRGGGGGYRLRPGYRIPPLMFTADEAATVALGLIAARRDGLDADTALAKVRRVLPDAVRIRVEALEDTLRFTGDAAAAVAADPAPPPARHPADASSPTAGGDRRGALGERLLALGEAARRGRRVHARYTDSRGATSDREFSPFGVVAHFGRWYVPGFDHGRGEERALRADRFGDVRIGAPGQPAPPAFDAAAFVARALARVPWLHEVEFVVHAAPIAVAERFPPHLAELSPSPEGTLVRMRADSLDWVAGLLAGAGHPFTLLSPAPLRDAVHALANRLARA
jgi:predicted DNA-binding transcriptional regulator YafY